ncbi:MAG: hypothetical protein WC748_09900 [Legionellales bacterium]|jgi:hypothetical protein
MKPIEMKAIQIGLRVTLDLYEKLKSRAIEESAKTGEIISIVDLIRLAISQYLAGGK